MNRFGYSSRLGYEGDCAYADKLTESTGTLQYMLDSNKIYNCNTCSTTMGPRSGRMGVGGNIPVDNRAGVAQSPEIVNIESVLLNRNVRTSKCKKDGANPIDVTKFKTKNPIVCNDYLDPMSSKLSYPAANYRDVGINRFYNLRKNPQNINTIYWDNRVNTTLEIKDNYYSEDPECWTNGQFPVELQGKPRNECIKTDFPLYKTS